VREPVIKGLRYAGALFQRRYLTTIVPNQTSRELP